MLILFLAEKKVLLYFSLDYRGEIQELTFDQPQVHTVFYGSFHKVCVKGFFFFLVNVSQSDKLY